MTNDTKNNIFNEAKQQIINLLQNNIKKIILYGSFARNSDTDESDIDLVIFTELNPDEIKKYDDKINDITVELSLKYDKVFSFLIINSGHYNKYLNVLPFYQNILKDGIVIYGR
jgi:predicted nucleotidyltransferase